jgi:hypothetical protein
MTTDNAGPGDPSSLNEPRDGEKRYITRVLTQQRDESKASINRP